MKQTLKSNESVGRGCTTSNLGGILNSTGSPWQLPLSIPLLAYSQHCVKGTKAV